MLNHFLVFLSTVHLSASLVSMAFLNILNLQFILSLICLLIHEEDTLPSLLSTEEHVLRKEEIKLPRRTIRKYL